MTVLQIVIGGLSLFLLSGLLIYVLRNQQVQMNSKADKSLCDEKHRRIDQDLMRGQAEFKELHEDIKLMTAAQNETNTHLKLIKQQIEIYIKKIE